MPRTRWTASLAVVAVAVATGAVAFAVWPARATTAALANPGFESGLSGWTCTSASTVDTGHAHSGTSALLGSPTGSDNAACTQSVPVEADTAYTMSAHVSGGYVFLGASGAAAASTWTPDTGGTYQRLTVAFRTGAAASSVTVSIHGWYGQPPYHADDLALTRSGSASTPVPTTSAAPATPVPTTSASPATPVPTTSPTGGSGAGVALPACRHFSDVVPPARTEAGARDAATLAPAVDLGARLPAPGGMRTVLVGGAVTVTFDRVPGAVAYRVWRNGQSVQRTEDWGQPSLSVTDRSPCQRAYYTVAALRGDDSDASLGQLSQPYQLTDGDVAVAAPLAPGTQLTLRVTAYNDAGQTASGYLAGLGLCAVDARTIPWGTRLKVDGYGYCYAADIGTWIQGDIIDVWLPGTEADTWGVQRRTATVVAAP